MDPCQPLTSVLELVPMPPDAPEDDDNEQEESTMAKKTSPKQRPLTPAQKAPPLPSPAASESGIGVLIDQFKAVVLWSRFGHGGNFPGSNTCGFLRYSEGFRARAPFSRRRQGYGRQRGEFLRCGFARFKAGDDALERQGNTHGVVMLVCSMDRVRAVGVELHRGVVDPRAVGAHLIWIEQSRLNAVAEEQRFMEQDEVVLSGVLARPDGSGSYHWNLG